MFENFKDEIILRLGPLSKSPNGFMKRNCMLCDLAGQGVDKRKRFGIIFTEDSISVNCFNCAFKATWRKGHELNHNFKTFLSRIGFTDDALKKIEFDIFKYKFSSVPVEKTHYSAMSAWDPMDLPEDSRKIYEWADDNCTDPDFLKVCIYAHTRRLHNFENLYWTPKKGMNKRLIVPFFFRNKIVGYTGRYVYPINNPAMPKYLNYMPKSYLYNFDAQQDYRRKTVIVYEGILDAYQMDGMSPLGSINNEQADIIDSLGKDIVVVPDRDKAGEGLYDMAVSRGWGIAFPKWEDGVKDAARASEVYGRLYTLQTIVDNVERDPIYLKIKKELESGK